MLKAPDLADRWCRSQRIISPASASSPSLAPMDHRTSIPKVRARYGTTSTVCLPTVVHCYLAHEGMRVDLTGEVEGAEYIERFLHEEERMAILLIGGDKRRAYDALLNLAELREAQGLTQAELAERLGVSQPNVRAMTREFK
jgi:hypothetical protein